jgi:hypothetical protein
VLAHGRPRQIHLPRLPLEQIGALSKCAKQYKVTAVLHSFRLKPLEIGLKLMWSVAGGAQRGTIRQYLPIEIAQCPSKPRTATRKRYRHVPPIPLSISRPDACGLWPSSPPQAAQPACACAAAIRACTNQRRRLHVKSNLNGFQMACAPTRLDKK